jgi:hypothetical protein
LVFSLAKETGWSEDHLLDMPLGRLWTYKHALLRSYDSDCFYLTSAEEKQELFDIFNKL